MIEWLYADPVRLYVLWGTGGILAGTLLILAARWGWHHGDPPYNGDRRRKAQPDAWDRDPSTGALILDGTTRDRIAQWRASLAADIPADRTQVLRPPPRSDLEARRSLDPGWRRAILSPTGSWSMPNDGRKHHRATGGPKEETRQLHPGYVAEARARVARGEPADPDHLLD